MEKKTQLTSPRFQITGPQGANPFGGRNFALWLLGSPYASSDVIAHLGYPLRSSFLAGYHTPPEHGSKIDKTNYSERPTQAPFWSKLDEILQMFVTSPFSSCVPVRYQNMASGIPPVLPTLLILFSHVEQRSSSAREHSAVAMPCGRFNPKPQENGCLTGHPFG